MFDYQAALKAGYTPEEIKAFVTQNNLKVANTPPPQPQESRGQVIEPTVAPQIQPTPEPVTIDREAAKQAGYTDQEINSFLANPTQETVQTSSTEPVEITQTFGQSSPYDVFSGGVNYGVDYATKAGTDVNLPEGEWEVEDAYKDASPQGYIGNFENQGYGNSVVVRNRQTGEKLRLSHLSDVEVAPGQIIKGGRIARTGASGNVTGEHLDAEYYDPEGNPSDILQTPYGKIIPYKDPFTGYFQ